MNKKKFLIVILCILLFLLLFLPFAFFYSLKRTASLTAKAMICQREGFILLREEKFEKAIIEFKKSSKYFEKLQKYSFFLRFLKSFQVLKAGLNIEEYSDAKCLRIFRADTHEGMARVYAGLKRYEEAIKEIENAYRLHPDISRELKRFEKILPPKYHSKLEKILK